jgi:hypothetical protein
MKYFTNLVLLITLIIFGTYIRADSQSSCALNQVTMNQLTVTGSVIANSVNGIVNAAQMPGADIGAKVNAAMGSMPNGGTVYIPAGSYNFSTTIQCPVTSKTAYIIEGAGSGMAPDTANQSTYLAYTGTGDAINQFVTVFANQNTPGCELRDLLLDGTNAGAAAVGYHFGGTEHGAVWRTVIKSFKGAGIKVENGPTGEWTERFDLEGMLWLNAIGINFVIDSGGNSSLGHGVIREWFNADNNQIGIQVNGSGGLYSGRIDIDGNFGSGNSPGTGATVWKLLNGGQILAGTITEGEECQASTSCVRYNIPSGTGFSSTVIRGQDGGPFINILGGIYYNMPFPSEHIISAQIPDNILGNQFHIFPMYPVALQGSNADSVAQVRMFCGFPNTCSTYPTFQLYDATATAYVAGASVTCAAGTTVANANSYTLIPNHTYTINDTVAPVGCTANNFFTVAVDQIW